MPEKSVMLPAGPAISGARVVWDVSEQGQALLAVLFPHLAGPRVHRVEDTGDAVMIAASCQAGSATCPRCGQASAQVHGGYGRTVADGVAADRTVLIALQVRQFRCRNLVVLQLLSWSRPGAERAIPAAQHPAAGHAGRVRAGAGRACRRPAGGDPRDRGLAQRKPGGPPRGAHIFAAVNGG